MMISIILGVAGGFLLATAVVLAVLVSMVRHADRTNPWRNCTYKVNCQCAGCIAARAEGRID